MATGCDFTQTKQCSYKKLREGLVFSKLWHMKKIKAYTLQGKWTGDFDSNNKWYKDEALKLKGKEIDLLILPELFHTPYFPFEENALLFVPANSGNCCVIRPGTRGQNKRQREG